MDPDDEIVIARHPYRLIYSPSDLGAVGPPPDVEVSEILEQGLMERAGLVNRDDEARRPRRK